MNFKEILKEAIKNNTKIIITGRSGYGKSEMVTQVAEELGYELIDFRLSEVLPEDLVGIPKVKDDYYEYVPPKWLYDVVQNPDKKYLLFLDEITQGTPEVLNICYKIFDKVTRVGNYTLNNVAVLGATNYSNESNYLSELPQPLKNRACMLELDHSEKIYSEYLLDKYKSYISSLSKDEVKVLTQFLNDAIKETNPRSTDKAIELIHNNCSKELVIPFIGYTNYANLHTYFSTTDSSMQAANLSNLEKALKDISNGFIVIKSKRYDIEEPANLLAMYNLNDEEYACIEEAYRNNFAGNKPGNKRGTIYAILTSKKDDPCNGAQLKEIASKSYTFSYDQYATKLNLMTKNSTAVQALIEQIELIRTMTNLTPADIFEAQGSWLQYCSPELLIHYNNFIDWKKYASYYKAGRISAKAHAALSQYYSQYI